MNERDGVHEPSELARARREVHDLGEALNRACPVVWLDRRGVVQRVNALFEDLGGWPGEDLVGRPFQEFVEDPGQLEEGLATARGDVWRGELLLRGAPGDRRVVRVTLASIGVNGRGILGILDDVTSSVHMAAAEAKLRRREAQAQVGQMAGVVAHDVRNALAGIGGALQIIAARLPDGSSEREIVGEIQARLDSLNALVGDLLLVARPLDRIQLEPTSVRRVLTEAADAARHDGVDVDVAEGDVTVRADRSMLQHMFANLLRNAVEATEPEGRVEVELEELPGACRVRIRDAGRGIAAEDLARVVEPFFTTKSQGTGLGLPIARRVAEEVHQGRLEIASTPGRGTVVTVILPREPDRLPRGRSTDRA